MFQKWYEEAKKVMSHWSTRDKCAAAYGAGLERAAEICDQRGGAFQEIADACADAIRAEITRIAMAKAGSSVAMVRILSAKHASRTRARLSPHRGRRMQSQSRHISIKRGAK